MISEATRRLLIASKVKGVGKKTLQDLALNRLFFELPVEDWHLDIPALHGFAPSSPAFSKALASADADIESAEKQRAFIISTRDEVFPSLLKKVKDRPTVLFVRGDPSNFSDKAVAVVGTREPTPHGRVVADRVTRYFAEKGWQIVSGLAIGLDTQAHQSTLEVGGSTVAVLAHGLDAIYPKQNAALAEDILENRGLLVSEYGYGTPSFRTNFVERDRIQAALARGVVMVQSGETGGSWHASRASLGYGRWLFVPAPTSKDVSAGSAKARGNQVMAEGTVASQLEVLRCEPTALKQLMVLRSREDYPTAEFKMEQLPP